MARLRRASSPVSTSLRHLHGNTDLRRSDGTLNIDSVAGCVLCEQVSKGVLVAQNDLAVAIADAFPLSPGHHLVITRRHEADFFALDREEIMAIVDLVASVREHIAARFEPDGFNVGVNVGEAGGQTIPHVHVHLIPRYYGDVVDPRGGIRQLIPSRAAYWDRA
jgi:diadenosine tetraphosphate (Ap4A) HIT family hydrolase